MAQTPGPGGMINNMKQKSINFSNNQTVRSFAGGKNSYMDMTGGFSLGTPQYYQGGKIQE